jgi:hypothetical protein
VSVEAGKQLEVNIGRIYAPKWDDTLQSVASRFAITPERLKQVDQHMPTYADVC